MNEPAQVRKNRIATVLGKKGSGKSQLLYEYFVKSEERIISLDFVGEVGERNKNAILCVGYVQLVKTVLELHNSNVRRWHLQAVFDQYNEQDLPQLFRLLAPPFDPKKPGLSRALGGIALECSECDVILPNGRASLEAKNMLKRGRHEQLSLFLGTQRPQECDRLCTSQSDYIISFRMHEPREMEYISKVVSPRFAEMVRQLPQYNSAWYHSPSGEVEQRDENGETVQRFNLGDGPEQLRL